MKTGGFWDIAPCSLFEVDGRFRGAYCFHHRPDDGDSMCTNSGGISDDNKKVT
jgi:hypothetical protein